MIKAQVISGRYAGNMVRITNVSVDDSGRKNAACFLNNGDRANIPVTDLKIIEEAPHEGPAIPKAKTASMPFVSGSSSSRTLTHTKNMNRSRLKIRSSLPVSRIHMRNCESCGIEYNSEERKGLPGKVTQCESCAIEIKKDGELRHEAKTFDSKEKV